MGSSICRAVHASFSNALTLALVSSVGYSMDSHESASHAIVALNNSLVRDRNIKVWWGRERSPSDAGLPPLAPEFELYVDPQAAAYFGPGPTVWIPASGTIPQPPSPGSEASTYRLYPQFVAYPAAAIAPEA